MRAQEHARRGLSEPDAELSAEAETVLASLAAEGPDSLLRVLLAVRRARPAAAAHLLLAVLSPAAWELVAVAGERLEAALAGGGVARAEALVQAAFDELYSAVGDRDALLRVMLARKEALAAACLQRALSGALSLPGLRLGNGGC